MANKKKSQKSTYKVGYKKPPKNTRWKKGCPSPNPKGRPKKPETIKEFLQINLNREIFAKDEKGKSKKITCAEALVIRTLADAIAKDGATRRMLFKQEFFELMLKEQEYEYPPEERNVANIEKVYGDLLYKFASLPEKSREFFRIAITEFLRDQINEQFRQKDD